jgi:hypothetical protein
MSRRNATPVNDRPIKFDQKLVLNQWLLGLLEVSSVKQLTEWLRDPELEGFDENNISRYCHVLRSRLINRAELFTDLLLAYDQNIVRHWKRITEKRNAQGNVLYPKYFQYLALLFSEVYIDRFFGNPYKLLTDLNQQVERFNQSAPGAAG